MTSTSNRRERRALKAAARRRPGQLPADAARLIEILVRQWVEETPDGRRMAAELGLPHQTAAAELVTLIHQGHAKILTHDDAGDHPDAAISFTIVPTLKGRTAIRS